MKKEIKISFEKTPVMLLKTMSIIILIISLASTIALLAMDIETTFKIVSSSFCLSFNLALFALLRGSAFNVESNHIQNEINHDMYHLDFNGHTIGKTLEDVKNDPDTIGGIPLEYLEENEKK